MKYILLILILTIFISCEKDESLLYFKIYEIPAWNMLDESRLEIPIENIENAKKIKITIKSDHGLEFDLLTYDINPGILTLESNEFFNNGAFVNTDINRGIIYVYFELNN